MTSPSALLRQYEIRAGLDTAARPGAMRQGDPAPWKPPPPNKIAWSTPTAPPAREPSFTETVAGKVVIGVLVALLVAGILAVASRGLKR